MEYIDFLKKYILDLYKIALEEIAKGNKQNATRILRQINELKQDGYKKGVTL